MMPATFNPTPARRHRFHLLDALRGVAALMVATLHTAGLVDQRNFAANAHLAVDFFFCLSGFVIAFSYEKRLAEGMSLKSFIVARMLRLYPMVFLAMTIGLLKSLAVQIHHPSATILWQKFGAYAHGVTMVPHIGPSDAHQVFPLDNAAWSLFFELLANLVLAFLMIRRRLSVGALALVALVSLTLVLLGLRADVALIDMGSDSRLIPFLMGLPRVALSSAMGILILKLYRTWSTRPDAVSVRIVLALVVTSSLLFLLTSPLPWMQTVPFEILTATLLLPALVWAGSLIRIPDRLSGICSLMGELSYPLYLLHIVFNYAFASFGMALASRWPALHGYLLILILVADLIAAYLVYRFADRPIRRFLQMQFIARSETVPSLAAFGSK